MNGKDVVAVIMAVNKIGGPYFSTADESVSAGKTQKRRPLPINSKLWDVAAYRELSIFFNLFL